jgi:hypothetical protein
VERNAAVSTTSDAIGQSREAYKQRQTRRRNQNFSDHKENTSSGEREINDLASNAEYSIWQ